ATSKMMVQSTGHQDSRAWCLTMISSCITENGVEYLTYAEREALLAAYGFEGEKPFYEYHDQF
ncbi:MAG: hypothetical protein K2N44_07595, partial [Lachnospiraceae bacterium]|nr:hypothetical protein [Lachnospiraceae bacterium]